MCIAVQMSRNNYYICSKIRKYGKMKDGIYANVLVILMGHTLATESICALLFYYNIYPLTN